MSLQMMNWSLHLSRKTWEFQRQEKSETQVLLSFEAAAFVMSVVAERNQSNP